MVTVQRTPGMYIIYDNWKQILKCKSTKLNVNK